MTPERRTLLYLEIPFGLMGAALIAIAALFARRGIPAWIPPALIVRLGIASPLTGMTRSFVALASGDLSRAFELHPLGPLVFVACFGSIAIAVASWARGGRFSTLARLTANRALWFCIAAAFAAVWVRQTVVFR